MEQTNFHPNVGQDSAIDTVANRFLQFSQNIFVIILGFIPIIFIPLSYAPFGFTKTMIVVAALMLCVLFLSFSVLRSGRVSLQMPLILVAFWSIAGVSVLSALFSNDMHDALIGDTLGVQTALFTCLLALIATVAGVLRGSKLGIVRLYMFLVLSACILFLFHIVRLFTGADVLSFGIFNDLTAGPLGDWNDLAVFFGLIIIIIMMALEQLPLAKVGQIILAVVTVMSLFMLTLINYSAVWIVLGVVSMIQLFYSLTKHRFVGSKLPFDVDASIKVMPMILTSLVFLLSLSFMIAGSTIGGYISNHTNVSYVEVRPSVGSTIDVMREVYAKRPMLGYGPNRFVDSWRMYKNPRINETAFWNVNFDSGSGMIPTAFATTGILGAVAWVFFFLVLLYSAVRMLFSNRQVDTLWYFIGTSSLVASLYFWVIALIYNPSTVMLMVAAACTGIFATAYTTVVPHRQLSFYAARSRSRSVLLIGLIMILIVGSISATYALSRDYVALWGFNKALASVKSVDQIDQLEAAVTKSYATAASDSYARELAYYQLIQLESLLQNQDPSDEDVKKFQDASATGVQAAQAAVDLDWSDPRNHLRLAQIYSVLAVAGVDGADERAVEQYDFAIKLDPHNPSMLLAKSQHKARLGDTEEAIDLAKQAVDMKSNYTQALIFLAQLDIAAGETKAAIARVRSVITYEPNNPARYYQLGVLLLADKKQDAAKQAFTRAIALDDQYSNARYYLALVYLKQGEPDAALEQLREVEKLNPDNEDLQKLISQVESGDIENIPGIGDAVGEAPSVSNTDGDVTVNSDPDTNLVTPVNAVPNEGTTATQNESPEATSTQSQ